MRTRSQSRNLNRQQQQAPPAFVEPFNLEEPIENPAPPVGYEDAIIVPEITVDNFELKHGLLTLVQNKQFFGHDKEDPHAHIRYFNKITSMMKFPNVPSTSVKLMLFPFSLEEAARIWLEKEPTRSIQTWDDLVSKFINKFFPPSKTTNLRNEITRFKQRFDETFYEAWARFNDLLQACPHHGFPELHQLDTFYNALNSNDQDSLNSAAGGNFLDKMPRDCLRIIESKAKVRNSRNKPIVAKVSSSTSTPGISSDVAELKDMVKALLLDKKNQSPAPTPVKTVEESCVTYGGTHSYQNCPATNGNVYRDNIQEYVSQAAAANYNHGNTGYRTTIANQIRPPAYQPPVNQGQIYRPQVVQPPTYQAPAYQAPLPQIQGVSKEDFQAYVKANDAVMMNMQTQGQNMQNQLTNLMDMLSKFVTSNTASTSGTLLSNTVTNPKEDLKGITTRSGVAYKGPTIPTTSSPKVVELIFPPFEEADSFLAIDDDPTSPEVDPIYYDPDGDILLLEANSLIDLPPHLEYAFLEGNDKLPVIIAKDLKNKEKAALIEVLKSHKRASLGNFADNKVKETGRRSSYPDFVEIKINSRQELMEIFLSKLWIVALRVDRPHGLQISYITSEDFIVKECHHSKKNKFFKRCQTLTSGTTPSVQNLCKSSALACVHAKKLSDILEASTIGPTGGHHCANSHRKKRTNTHLSGALRQAVYMKACHLPIELEHKAYWVLKHANFDLKTAGDQRKVQLNELSELRDQDYENSLIYKEKNKRKFMTQRFKNRVFT
ncbi:reverse transcriptase domain-containing protein [Tanacetum coccineum]